MPLATDTNFKSDDIGILAGFDESEPKAWAKWSKQFKDKFPCRIVFAINQHYPELNSGCYRNKNLIALTQEAFRELGLFVVIADNYSEGGIVPTELFGSLETGDDYLLVDKEQQICGRLNLWDSLGGKSPFYHDRFIIEVVIDEKRGKELAKIVEAKCRAKSVGCKMAA